MPRRRPANTTESPASSKARAHCRFDHAIDAVMVAASDPGNGLPLSSQPRKSAATASPQPIAEIAATGVDLISSGWITHSAPILNLGLDIAG
jgi:hypothetical protein